MKALPRTALIFILLNVVIDSTGFGIIIPVLPKLLEHLVGGGMSNAAPWGSWLTFVFASLQFITTPIIGNLSDRFGRRPLLLFSLFAYSIDFLVMGLAPTIGWLFVGRALSGVFAATYSTAAAYIGDISDEKNRARNFGMIGAAWGVGFIVGPVIGGFAGSFGPRVPFFVASALAFANGCFGLLALPESLAPERRRAFSWARANALGALRSLSHFPTLIGLMAATFFFRVAHDSLPSVWSYFVVEKFHFTERQIGYSLGFVGVLTALVMGVLTGRIVPLLGERRAVLVGFGFATCGFLLIAIAPGVPLLFAALAVFALGGIANPALQAVMSRQVGPSMQGELQGALASMMSITMALSPLMMAHLFSHFTAHDARWYFPGAPYLLAALLTLVCLLLCMQALPAATVATGSATSSSGAR